MKIRSRLLLGFAVVVGLSAAMGLYAATDLGRISGLAAELYDKPLMAIDFSRSAFEGFTAMRSLTEARATGVPIDLTAFDQKRQEVLDALAVVAERSPDADGRKRVDEIKGLLGGWTAAVAAPATAEARIELERRADALAEKFDIMIEGAKEQGLTFRDDVAATSAQALLVIRCATAVNALLGIAIALLLARSIASPIGRITGAMTRLAGGESAIDIPGLGRKDETGAMAAALQVFKVGIGEAERLRAERTEREQRAAQERRVELHQLAEQFEGSVKSVVGAVSSAAAQMRGSAQQLSATASETRRQSAAVSSASQQASTNVQTVAAATEELSSSIAEIGQQVSQSSETTAVAVTEAARSNALIQSLAGATEKIGDVVKLITDIAGRTNLLALNATIEAARAGEAGKGFAVVASEVKGLANQTAKATNEIRHQIDAIQSASRDAVQAIDGVGKIITSINGTSSAIAAAVEQQGAATLEISRNIQEAATGTGEVSSNIAGVTLAATDMGDAAGQVLSAADVLLEQSSELRDKVDAFLVTVRAA
jgi:methyl-accepting chemotaxis protein